MTEAHIVGPQEASRSTTRLRRTNNTCRTPTRSGAIFVHCGTVCGTAGPMPLEQSRSPAPPRFFDRPKISYHLITTGRMYVLGSGCIYKH